MKEYAAYVNRVDLDGGPKGLATVDVRMHVSPEDARKLSRFLVTKIPAIRVLVPSELPSPTGSEDSR